MAPNKSKHRTPGRLIGPAVNQRFNKSLDALVATARLGQHPDSEFFNPSDEWLVDKMKIFQRLPSGCKNELLKESSRIQSEIANAEKINKASTRAGPEIVVELDRGGLAFFSQLGVARRPDLTHYFVDGFTPNRDALSFNEENQELFVEVIDAITKYMDDQFNKGNTVLQTDRRIGDAPGRSFHARQLVGGSRFLQLPYMWRQLTFEMKESDMRNSPDILEISLPDWLDNLDISEDLRKKIQKAGLTQLIFKAPTKGLSLHLGFDYAGEHKMGPLSIAMFLVKQSGGLAVQASLSVARVRNLEGNLKNTALVTLGPSLHGKSTLTIMIELAGSKLAKQLGLANDKAEGIYPMNDDIVLLQKLQVPLTTTRDGSSVTVPYGIDGTENNFYAVPFGLTYEDDPITFDVVRGPENQPNNKEVLENVPVDVITGRPDFLSNPVRNMRMILSRSRLLDRKGVSKLLTDITRDTLSDSVHVPMEYTDQIFWQAVMRQNTVIPPLRRLTLEQYIRVLMYGEAVQMGAAAGVVGKPYIEYFSDPFIIGIEDENANMMYQILRTLANEGLPQHYYVFNTGGIGADNNDAAQGKNYRKIPRDLTLMLQEALLREAVVFEYDPVLRSSVAVSILDTEGSEIFDLRKDWMPARIYGDVEYARRVLQLTKRRYYGHDIDDRAGILRYTKVLDQIIDLEDVPPPTNERELSCLLSFYWHVDEVQPTLKDLVSVREQGEQPQIQVLRKLGDKYRVGLEQGLELSLDGRPYLYKLGIVPRA